MPRVTHYYVWYRVAGDPAAARAAVDALLHDVFRTRASPAACWCAATTRARGWRSTKDVADVRAVRARLPPPSRATTSPRYRTNGARHTEPFVAPV